MRQEGIALEESESEWEPAAGQSLVSLLETPPATALARGSEAAARRGLLWLLDEEALRPRPSDSAFLERALDMYNTRGQSVLDNGSQRWRNGRAVDMQCH